MSDRYDPAEWPHGLRCGECRRSFVAGQAIVSQLAEFIGDTPSQVPVCEPCGLATPVRGAS